MPASTDKSHKLPEPHFYKPVACCASSCLQCFDTVGWVQGTASASKIKWWGVGVVICLEQGADCLHMVQLMPSPSYLASFQSRLVLPFWYRLTQVIPKRGCETGVVVVVVACCPTWWSSKIFKNIKITKYWCVPESFVQLSTVWDGHGTSTEYTICHCSTRR